MSTPLTGARLEQALVSLTQPTDLLKFGHAGKPKFRLFRLSPTFDALLWESATKDASRTRIPMSSITKIQFGQRSKVFQRNKRPDLKHLSFSIYYKSPGVKDVTETLDLVCKDASEFELWTCILIGLYEQSFPKEILERSQEACLTASLRTTLTSTQREEILSSMDHETKGTEITAQKKKLKNSHKDLLKEAITSQNELYTCGWNEWGQCCVEDTSDQYIPQVVPGLLGKGVADVSLGWSHSVIVMNSGDVCAAGNKLGTGFDGDSTVVSDLDILKRFEVERSSCGFAHSAVVTESGELWIWGSGSHGQLGVKTDFDFTKPVLLKQLINHKIESVSCGYNFTVALTSDRQVFSWGINEHGCLGHGDTQQRDTPHPIGELEGAGVEMIAAGEFHVIAESEHGLFSWGWNANGQLGIGGRENRLVPTKIDALDGYRVYKVSCGNAHSGVIAASSDDEHNRIFLWGSNMQEQLGHEDVESFDVPTQIDQFNSLDILDISCGAFHTAVVTSFGQALLAGSNLRGQLGLGKDVHSTAIFQEPAILLDKNVRKVICGAFNTAFLVARQWVDDAETDLCMGCRKAFTMRLRKHHCRNCGGIFCNACSSKSSAILQYGITRPVRVCDACFVKLGR